MNATTTDHPRARLRARLRLALASLGACVLVCACEHATLPEPSAARNLVVVVVDTLRADKLGLHGNPRGLTPSIDRLASQGVVFENASSHAPWTLPATASLLCSQYPEQHGAGGFLPQLQGLAPGVPTLATQLSQAGFTTAAIVNVVFLGPRFGLSAGFASVDLRHFENNREMRRADATTDAALEWLGRHAHERFFLLVHYFDPHALYDPPQPFRRRFAQVEDRESDSAAFGSREQIVALRTGALQLDAATIGRAEALYDGEVAYTDAEIGRLLDGLAALDLDDTTAVVLTADHGEEFLDHGGFEHGHTLHAELLHVPLIVRAPGLPAGVRISASVRHVDVAPTACALLGVPTAPSFAGASLLPLLAQAAPPDRPVLAHGNFWAPPSTSLREGELKLIEPPPGPNHLPQLYRWRSDPRERADLAATQPRALQVMRERSSRVREQLELGAGTQIEMSETLLRELERLGYGGR